MTATRKPLSKVNQLREINAKLTKEANSWQDMANDMILWIHANCTEDQKQEFSKFLKEHCNKG